MPALAKYAPQRGTRCRGARNVWSGGTAFGRSALAAAEHWPASTSDAWGYGFRPKDTFGSPNSPSILQCSAKMPALAQFAPQRGTRCRGRAETLRCSAKRLAPARYAPQRGTRCRGCAEALRCSATRPAPARYAPQRGTRCRGCAGTLRCSAKMPAPARYEPQRRTRRRGCAEAFAVQCADACTCKICTTAQHTVPWCAEHFECAGVWLFAKGHLQQPNTGGFHFRCGGVRLSVKAHFREAILAEHHVR